MQRNSRGRPGQCSPGHRPTHWPTQEGEATDHTLMKFCYQCGKASAGDPLFCTKCGRSYDIRLCPRLHKNSRWATVCSQCGSRELSEAQPQVSFWWKALEFLAKVGAAVFLVYISLTALTDFLQRPRVQAGLLIVAVLVGLLWWAWTQLPQWFRRLVWRNRKEHDRER
jgi:predicted amidophosphoribosyltransferase